ncbi:MAG: RNA polymerase subunit sigma-70 [Chloroflexi bacterium]|nr:RNA polymerase subunit sigma-70 [Chloroflexota bacterium]
MTAQVQGDDAFQQLVEAHQHAVRVHCYRLLGSLQDAEDLTQETLLRAWRSLDRFEGRASLRAWLYRIATNACFDEIDRRARRALPDMSGTPHSSFTPGPPVPAETPWLDPMPDAWLELADESPGPEARYEAKESIELAFVAALQQLPGRQRAALLLRDVLGWSTDEVAEILDLSTAATHSVLQRARANVGRPVTPTSPRLTQEAERNLVDRYMGAWERGDVQELLALLKADARLSMPPLPEWYIGREAIAEFFQWVTGPGGGGPYRSEPTHANGAPAFRIYAGDEPSVLQVVEADAEGIVSITSFMNPSLFRYFQERGRKPTE